MKPHRYFFLMAVICCIPVLCRCSVDDSTSTGPGTLIQQAESMTALAESLTPSKDRHRLNMRNEQESLQMKRFEEQNRRALEAFLAEKEREDYIRQRNLLIRGVIFMVLIALWMYAYLRKRKRDRLAAGNQDRKGIND